ncbi:hypothetical protein PN36_27705 [Candidatus Thiomargarita nelsonii]|uniref:ATP-binding protein n=1 Tax=Candidatus Thiomargarita nelsonii TaxID=1003181 RepID=A0A0A6RX61_9GAMM|nr:hypothetical protein PN36_27705 [Candidatus Thiomargarita nelsonii]
MLKSLKIKKISLFSNAEIEFSPGLNVVIGENNTGKSHLLKLAYAVATIWYEAAAEHKNIPGKISSKGSKSWWQRRLAEKLVGVFKPDKLGRLSRRDGGRQKAQIEAQIFTASNLKFAFTTNSQKEVEILQTPSTFPPAPPIFLPTGDVLSLCKALNGFLMKGAKRITAFIEPLETIMGGQLRLKQGRFYLKPTGKKEMEISLVAEGLRKIGTLSYLAANGSLSQQNLLFWDEPEAYLNAKVLTQLARSLVELVEKYEVQLILATHSFFLMKELSVLVEISKGKIPAQFISLAQGEIEQGDLLEDVSTITVLDEILAQDDRVQQLFYEGQL